MKIAIKILNEKHSKVTQELLFSHGYNWSGSLKNHQHRYSYLKNKYICLHNKSLTYGWGFEHNYTFLRLKELKEHLTNNS